MGALCHPGPMFRKSQRSWRWDGQARRSRRSPAEVLSVAHRGKVEMPPHPTMSPLGQERQDRGKAEKWAVHLRRFHFYLLLWA